MKKRIARIYMFLLLIATLPTWANVVDLLGAGETFPYPLYSKNILNLLAEKSHENKLLSHWVYMAGKEG